MYIKDRYLDDIDENELHDIWREEQWEENQREYEQWLERQIENDEY